MISGGVLGQIRFDLLGNIPDSPAAAANAPDELGFGGPELNEGYLTVPELKAQAQAEGAAFFERTVRVSGPLHKETLDWDAKTMTLKFHLAEGGEMFPANFANRLICAIMSTSRTQYDGADQDE